MAKWNFTIENGTALREAIYNDSVKQTVRCLYNCFKELYDKMTDEDKDYYKYDIEDTMEILMLYRFDKDCDEDEKDNINYYLQEFYNICDDVRAFVAL